MTSYTKTDKTRELKSANMNEEMLMNSDGRSSILFFWENNHLVFDIFSYTKCTKRDLGYKCTDQSVESNTVVSGVRGLRFKYPAGQIGHNVANGSLPLQHIFERSCAARSRVASRAGFFGSGSSSKLTKCQDKFEDNIIVLFLCFKLLGAIKRN